MNAPLNAIIGGAILAGFALILWALVEAIRWIIP